MRRPSSMIMGGIDKASSARLHARICIFAEVRVANFYAMVARHLHSTTLCLVAALLLLLLC